MIETTAHLMERQGYSGTGLNQILRESNAPRGSLYYHFPEGKEGLATEAILHRARGMSQNVMTQLASHSDPRKAVAAFIDSMIAHADETNCAGGAPIAAVALEASTTSETLRQACAQAYEMLQAPFAQKLRRAGLTEETAVSLATHITAALEGAIVLTRVRQSTLPLKAAKRQLDLLLAHYLN